MLLQRLMITVQLYGSNGLANHAAASAYGFLLSLAPMALIIAIIIFYVFKPSPGTISTLVGNIPLFAGTFDEQWLSSDFFTLAKPGISGVISVLSIFWATRILALSVQRGLKVVFPVEKSRNPLMNTLGIIVINIVVLFFILVAIVSSRTAMYFFRSFDFLPKLAIAERFFPIIALGFVSFFAYLFIPANAPRKFSAVQGALFCSCAYWLTAMALEVIQDKARLNFIYGTLGNLIILLINVYFFFVFFFLGAQLTYIIDNFDALLFSRIKQNNDTLALNAQSGKKPSRLNMSGLLFSARNNLSKYLRNYNVHEIIMAQGDTENDIYYLVEGEVEVFLAPPKENDIPASILGVGSFFGEMGYLLSEARTATVRAKNNVSVFVLPPSLFETILKFDSNLDRDIIERMSRRLKKSNEQIINLMAQ